MMPQPRRAPLIWLMLWKRDWKPVAAGFVPPAGNRVAPPALIGALLLSLLCPSPGFAQELLPGHFPDALHAVVFRNWPLVPRAKLAAVLKCEPADVDGIARSMGLPDQPPIDADRIRRSTITVIRRNWHLLPADQIRELLEFTEEHFRFVLREEDFLEHKLGPKPDCAPVRFAPASASSAAAAAGIKRVLAETFPRGLAEGPDPLFGFVRRLSEPRSRGAATNAALPASDSPPRKVPSPRYCYSYFALYGDPLIDVSLDPFPDGYLERLAEVGVDGVWLQGVLYTLAPFPWRPELSEGWQTRLNNLRNLVDRAKRRGIGVYLYLNEPRTMPADFFVKHPELKGVTEGNSSTLCTSTPEVREYLTESVAVVVRAVPDLAGIFTISASENLTNCWSHHRGKECPRCGKRTAAEVIAEVNSALQAGIAKANARTKFIAWDWGWTDASAPGIIARLPDGIAVQSVSEWDVPISRGGVESRIGEYSLSTIGPGPRATRHWSVAKSRGLQVSAKIQANCTWELSTVPWLPVASIAAEHAAALRTAGVDAIMLGWTLGGHPSPNLEVVSEVALHPELSARAALERVAARRFGRVGPKVIQAWNRCSAGMREFPFSGGTVYSGPQNVGPANLLWPTPTGKKATMVCYPFDDLAGWRAHYPADVFIAQLDKVAAGFAEGESLLAAAMQETEPAFQTRLAEEHRMAAAAHLHFRSSAMQSKFVLARDTLIGDLAQAGKAPQRPAPDAVRRMSATLDEIQSILTTELESAARMFELQSADSRLGFEASNHYFFVPIDLAEKALNCRWLLDRWLPSMRQRVAALAAVDNPIPQKEPPTPSSKSLRDDGAASSTSSAVVFDFRTKEAVGEWLPVQHIASIAADQGGMRLELAGEDPYLLGPVRSYPAGRPLIARIRFHADVAGSGQLFYFTEHAREEDSVRFAAHAGSNEAFVPLPPLGTNHRLRLDPPGDRGVVVVESIEIEPRTDAAAVEWPTPKPFALPDDSARRIRSGPAEIRHGPRWGEFEVRVDDRLLAAGGNVDRIAIENDRSPVWLDLANAETTIVHEDRTLKVKAVLCDHLGGSWTLERRFEAIAGGFSVTTSAAVDSRRRVLYLPMLTLLPGLGSYGARKTQGLFCGLEFLGNEPSSSTLDIEGPGAIRRIPAMMRVTIPLMAITHAGRYVGIAWTPSPAIAPLFDSPDRTWKANAHLLGLIAPGSDDGHRMENELLPFRALVVEPGRPVSAQAAVLAGQGEIVQAIAAAVAYAGLPDPPSIPPLQDYVRLAAAGWLDSGLCDESRYRHAVGPGFAPAPAADAAWMLKRLAELTSDPALANRLHAAARSALAAVPPGAELFANVGHLKHPVVGLEFDRIETTFEQARGLFTSLLDRFDADLVARYRPPKSGLDLSRTHFSKEASGLAALPVAQMLEAIVYTGRDELLPEAIERLDRLARFDHDVPRGAQTWEVPLHTPDILAAAHLVKAYVLGYELTGDRRSLDRAIRWAWTGVPFVYLRDPTPGPIGRYATTPVFGATHWQAPNWIGLPVQWCGLVYADALRLLQRHDEAGPWRRIADGIVASGIQQCYPLEHPRRGLLPDSFSLQPQQRNPADINPGTLQPLALELLTGVSTYDYHAGLGVVGPGKIDRVDLAAGSFRFTPSSSGPSRLILHRPRGVPTASIDGKLIAIQPPRRVSAKSSSVILELPSTTSPVRIRL